MKLIYFSLTLFLLANACGQNYVLYKGDPKYGKYVLTRCIQQSAFGDLPQVVIGDGIAVQTNQTSCILTISNAYVFTTTVPPGPKPNSKNSIVQSVVFAEQFSLTLPKDSKIIYDNSLTEFSTLRSDPPK